MFIVVYFHCRRSYYLSWSIFMGDLPSHSHWSIFMGDLPTHVHPGLFSWATCPHTHIGLFSRATCPYMFILAYFQGRPAHTLTRSIFMSDLPINVHPVGKVWTCFLLLSSSSSFWKFPNGRVLLIFLSVPRSQQWFSFIISSMILFFFLFFFQSCWTLFFFFLFEDFPVTNKNMCAMLWC